MSWNQFRNNRGRTGGGYGQRNQRIIRVKKSFTGLADALERELKERKEWRVKIIDCQKMEWSGLLRAQIDTDKEYLFEILADDWSIENTKEQKRRGVVFVGVVHYFDAVSRTIYFEDEMGFTQPGDITECMLLEPDYVKAYLDWATNRPPDQEDDCPSGMEVIDTLLQLESSPKPKLPKEISLKPCSPREAQKDALALSLKPLSLIWGPPGTGKTYTIGMIAGLHAEMGHKVFILAPTNAAADVAVLAVDDALTKLNGVPTSGVIVRTGRPIHPELERRQHLLAWTGVLKKYSEKIQLLQQEQEDIERGSRPLPAAAKNDKNAALAKIGRDLKDVTLKRAAELKRLCANAKVIVATIHSAFMNAQIRPLLLPESEGDETTNATVKNTKPQQKKTLIFDEASMVSRYVCMPFLEADLEHVIVAGDIRQFKPIRKSKDDKELKDENCEFWVGNNLFDVCHSDTNQEIQERLDEGLLSILREQSRMTEALAKPISDAFYLGQLITVKPPDSPPVAPGWPSDPVLLVEATESNLPPQTPKTIQNGMQQGGKVHETSAWIAIGLAQKLLTENPVLKVLILTPFKFQAKLLRQLSRSELSRYGKERIRAGTVHVAQGSEADVVIFDMVSPGHGWFKGCFAGSDSHERLACVAFSRAKRQIYVVAPEKEFLEVDLWQRVCPNYKMYTPAWNPPVRSAEAPRVRKARPK